MVRDGRYPVLVNDDDCLLIVMAMDNDGIVMLDKSWLQPLRSYEPETGGQGRLMIAHEATYDNG